MEGAVVGQDDDKGLTKPKAFVVLRDGFKGLEELVAELKKWVPGRLAKYKYPRWIKFVSQLSKSTTGKIQRNKLRH